MIKEFRAKMKTSVISTLKSRFRKILTLMALVLVLQITQGDCVYAALNATETTETKLGTITLPASGINRLVGISALLMQPLATSGETVSGYCRLAFGTVSGRFKFPAKGVAGAAAVGVIQPENGIIPVNIPLPANETIDVYMTANKALTGTGEGFVSLIFE